jgi:hypothetical protein
LQVRPSPHWSSVQGWHWRRSPELRPAGAEAIRKARPTCWRGPAATHAAIRAAIAEWVREVLEDCGVHVPWSSVREPHIRCKLERSDATKCKVEATLSF